MEMRSLKMTAANDGDRVAISARRRGAIGRIAVRVISLRVILDVAARRAGPTVHEANAIGVPRRNSRIAGGHGTSAHQGGEMETALITGADRRAGLDIITTPGTKGPAAAGVPMGRRIVDNRLKKSSNCCMTCEMKSRSSAGKSINCAPAAAGQQSSTEEARPAAVLPEPAAEARPAAVLLVPAAEVLPGAILGLECFPAAWVAREVAVARVQGLVRAGSEVLRKVAGPLRKCANRDAKIPVVRVRDAKVPVMNRVALKVDRSAPRAPTARRAPVSTTLRRCGTRTRPNRSSQNW